MPDIHINLDESDSALSKQINALSAGDRILLCRESKPVAEVRLLPEKKKGVTFGTAKGEFEVTDEFFEDLPDDILDAFEGTS